MKEIVISSKSGNLLATVFERPDSDRVLIIAAATGVKQKFYKKFAQFVAGNQITVVTFDYCGIGGSLNVPIKKLKVNAADWGRNDLESVIKYVIDNFPSSKKILLGHSIGGQLIGLSKSSKDLDKIILVAAQSGYWKFWKGFGKVKMWFNWHVVFPFLTKLFGYLPSKKITGMENLPAKVANQWRKWGMKNNYLLGDSTITESYFDQIDLAITAYSIEDDQFAPKEAVEWMTSRFVRAKIKSVHLLCKDYKTNRIGHFGVFKENFKNTIWRDILNEMNV